MPLKLVKPEFPPGTSKWNKIEHRMFCHITENWRGRPLISHEVIVNLIGHTTTNTGLTIQAELDKNPYPTGIKLSHADMKRLNLFLFQAEDGIRDSRRAALPPRRYRR